MAPALSLRRRSAYPKAARNRFAPFDRELRLLILLIVLVVLALGGGAWGHGRFGYAGWSPLGIILLIVLLLWLTGNLRL